MKRIFTCSMKSIYFQLLWYFDNRSFLLVLVQFVFKWHENSTTCNKGIYNKRIRIGANLKSHSHIKYYHYTITSILVCDQVVLTLIITISFCKESGNHASIDSFRSRRHCTDCIDDAWGGRCRYIVFKQCIILWYITPL